MDEYGLIGYPLGHSFSVGYFNEKFQNEDINAIYRNFELRSIDELQEIIDLTPNLKGINVTRPYKEEIIPRLDFISDVAKEIGAVNVVKILRQGRKTYLKGYNSDVVAFTKSIEALLEPCQKKALILGTGGASKAVAYGLRTLGIDYLKVSRTGRFGTLTYQEVTPSLVQEYNIIVNCTPCGMYPHTDECLELPYHAMTNHNLLYDLIYNPDETLFLKKGKAQGATIKNGLEMLLLQAFVSWEIWDEK